MSSVVLALEAEEEPGCRDLDFTCTPISCYEKWDKFRKSCVMVSKCFRVSRKMCDLSLTS